MSRGRGWISPISKASNTGSHQIGGHKWARPRKQVDGTGAGEITVAQAIEPALIRPHPSGYDGVGDAWNVPGESDHVSKDHIVHKMMGWWGV